MSDLMMALFMKRGVNARLNEQIWLISKYQINAGFGLANCMGGFRN